MFRKIGSSGRLMKWKFILFMRNWEGTIKFTLLGRVVGDQIPGKVVMGQRATNPTQISYFWTGIW